jgi:SAM-dependent methyltransferase
VPCLTCHPDRRMTSVVLTSGMRLGRTSGPRRSIFVRKLPTRCVCGRRFLAVADVGDGDTVVEVGCGTGPLLTPLADAVGAGGRVIGVEPQPVLARVAGERMGDRCEIRVESGSETALPDGIADMHRADRPLPSADGRA